jgi:hypothetical protein
MSTNTFKIIEGFAGLGFSLAGLGALFDAGMKQVTQASTSSNTWVPTSVFDTFGGFATPIPYALNAGSSGNPGFLYFVLLFSGVMLLFHAVWSMAKKL